MFNDLEDEEEYEIQEHMNDPIAFAASHHSDPDTMYVDQALKQPDRKQFIQAIKEEVSAHNNNGHWKVVKRSMVPDGMKVLPSLWAMKRT